MNIFYQVISEKETFKGLIGIVGIFQSLESLSKKRTEIIVRRSRVYGDSHEYKYNYKLDGKTHNYASYGVKPASYHSVGGISWKLVGKLHGFASQRTGPARIEPRYKESEWYEYGLPHRIGNPAKIHHDLLEEWYIKGKLHRSQLPIIGGPAVIYGRCGSYSGVREIWCYNGVPHRINGPSIISVLGEGTWYYKGYHIGKLIDGCVPKIIIDEIESGNHQYRHYNHLSDYERL